MILVEWLAEDGAEVAGGQPVCLVETSKATIEIESPGDGTLHHLRRAGDEVELGETIAQVAGAGEAPVPVDRPSDPASSAPGAAGSAVPTKKALRLAEQHGLDLTLIGKEEGFVTGEDVEAFLARAEAGGEPPEPDVRLAGTSTEGVSLPAHFGLADDAGRLDERFLESISSAPDTFRMLSSEERCEAYRANGARIGEGVTLGPGALILAPQIVVDDGVVLGDDGLVECAEVFAVGSLSYFEPGCRIRCRRAYFGASGYIGRSVVIGGGGAFDPWATFAAGDLLFIGDEAFLNVCRPVLLGREVFLTMRSVVVTHNVGHSRLEGFENRFAPVVLEDRAQVGIGTVVYAGCRIGREAIVGSNSYVVTNIPPGTFAIGVPAKVAGSAAHSLSPDRRAQMLRTMVDELRELLELRGAEVVPVSAGTARGFEVSHEGVRSLVLAADRLDAGFEPPETEGETVILTLELAGEPPPGSAVLDLLDRRVHGEGGLVLDSVREFCRKRGIRLDPGPWRYTGGLI